MKFCTGFAAGDHFWVRWHAGDLCGCAACECLACLLGRSTGGHAAHPGCKHAVGTGAAASVGLIHALPHWASSGLSSVGVEDIVS